MLIPILLVAIVVVVGVLLYRAGYLAIAAKGGVGALLCFCLACFVYGMVNGFHFYHASAQPGFEAGMVTVLFLGLAVGPFILVAGGLVAAAIAYAKRNMQKVHND
jgi:hypothetical protein